MVEGGGKRVVARLALLATLVLVVGVVFTLVEVEFSLRWRSGTTGVGSGGGSSVSLNTNNYGDGTIKHKASGAGKRDGSNGLLSSGEVDLEPPDALWTGGGKRAYAVVFPDVQDPLVLERARGLWVSLGGLKGVGEDVVAIVPRFFGQQLLAPLVDMGYRVLPRETPAPPWRANGRFVQQTITAIGPGWRSGGGGGHGWNLLALEALALTEYEEVVVLDQKVVIFPPVDPTQQLSPGRTRGGGDHRATALEADPGPGGREEAENGRRSADSGINRGGEEDADPGETQQRRTGAAGADGSTLPQLVPQGGGWAVAFAEGADSALAQGPGLRSLPGDRRGNFSGQHPAVMAVRPDADLYERISQLLCKGDTVFSETFLGMPAKDYQQRLVRDQVWERRAPTVPLLHLAVGMTSGSDGVTAKLPLEVCGGGDEFDSEDAGGGEGEAGVSWRWTGATVPIVWCPASPSKNQESEEQQRQRQRRRLGDRTAENVAGSPRPVEAERAPDSFLTGRGLGDGGGDVFGGGVERAGFEQEREWNVREGHGLVREIMEGGASPAYVGVPGATVTLGERGSEEQQLRRRPGSGPGRTGRGRRRSLRVDRTGGVVVAKGDDGVQEMIKRGLAGQQEEQEQKQGAGEEKGVEKDEGSERKEGGEEEGGGQGEERGENPGEGGGPTEKKQEETEEGEGEGGGEMEAKDGAVRLAWIPADPCSCADAPGVVGEACRGWLMARARANFSPTRGGQSSDGESTDRHSTERDYVVLALSACENGALASPLQLPALPAQQAARAAATAGAAHLARLSSPGGRGGGDGAEGGGSAGVPPPLWQESKPRDRPVVTEEDMKTFQHFWVANVEKKLLMVAIPKVACTQVHALFLRMQGSANWNSPHMEEIHYHKDMDKYKVKTMPGMTPERVSSILTDPTWTKAVFLRDPADRLLSCFLDKIVHRKSYSLSIFKAEEVLSFERFVSLTSKDARAKHREQYPGGNLGLSRRSNPHWKPQLYFGLDKFLPYFDFIGDFQHVMEHSEALLRRAGLWDEFGASGWGPRGNAAFFERATVRGHSTGSHDSKSQYYTPPLLASVREAYGPTDYKLLAGLGWWNETLQA
eukprot:g6489.t1